MNFYVVSILLTVSVFLPTLISAAGRSPQRIEHTMCRLMFTDEFERIKAQSGRRTRIEAYNMGRNGTLCNTTCRIRTGSRIKTFDPMPSPDFLLCAPGPRFCYRGNCSTASYISKSIQESRNLKTANNSSSTTISITSPAITTTLIPDLTSNLISNVTNTLAI